MEWPRRLRRQAFPHPTGGDATPAKTLQIVGMEIKEVGDIGSSMRPLTATGEKGNGFAILERVHRLGFDILFGLQHDRMPRDNQGENPRQSG